MGKKLSVPTKSMAFNVCPQCGIEVFKRSRAKGLKDEILKTFNVVAYRCKKCEGRFYGEGVTQKTREVSRQRLLTVVGLAGFMALIAFLLLVATRRYEPPRPVYGALLLHRLSTPSRGTASF